MPDGFPSPPMKHGGGYIIRVRIPRFNSTMYYDPVFGNVEEAVADDDGNGNGGGPTDGGTATCATFIPLGVGLLLAFVASKISL